MCQSRCVLPGHVVIPLSHGRVLRVWSHVTNQVTYYVMDHVIHQGSRGHMTFPRLHAHRSHGPMLGFVTLGPWYRCPLSNRSSWRVPLLLCITVSTCVAHLLRWLGRG